MKKSRIAKSSNFSTFNQLFVIPRIWPTISSLLLLIIIICIINFSQSTLVVTDYCLFLNQLVTLEWATPKNLKSHEDPLNYNIIEDTTSWYNTLVQKISSTKQNSKPDKTMLWQRDRGPKIPIKFHNEQVRPPTGKTLLRERQSAETRIPDLAHQADKSGNLFPPVSASFDAKGKNGKKRKRRAKRNLAEARWPRGERERERETRVAEVESIRWTGTTRVRWL